MRQVAIKRLQEALKVLEQQDPKDSQEAVKEVLAGKLPSVLFKDRCLDVKSRKRSHSGVSPYIPTGIRKKRGKKMYAYLESLLTDCISTEVDGECWMTLLKMDVGTVFTKVKKLPPSDQESFLQKFEEAKCVFECVLCDDIQPKSSYIYCCSCVSTYHIQCIQPQIVSESWICSDCT